jgi:hypothetical protein
MWYKKLGNSQGRMLAMSRGAYLIATILIAALISLPAIGATIDIFEKTLG